MSEQWTLALDDANATLEWVGGKGANLAKLARAGFSVPGGFLVTTAAYRAFVVQNGLDATINRIIAATDPADPDALEEASRQIRADFAAGAMPKAIAAEIRRRHKEIGAPAVAVRSSATAEDLPDLSFAGQQDTFLNINSSTLLKAVIDCWSSLWTARAIGYRARNHIATDSIALAVVVQQMVQSEASGVLFTANPLTGMRSESTVDAIFGLGEALVSGQVEPDHFIVESASGAIKERTLGAKALTIRSLADGGTESVAGDADVASRPALPDEVIRTLVSEGLKIESLYDGAPQDIEWAWAQDTLYILQARAITSLFPLPPGLSANPPSVLFSFAAVQGVFDPITPLGIDAFKVIGSVMGRLFGYDFSPGAAPAMKFAAQRIWLDLTPVVGNRFALGIFKRIFSMILPGGIDTLRTAGVIDGDRPVAEGPSPDSQQRLRGFFQPTLFAALRTLPMPDRARELMLDSMNRLLADWEDAALRLNTLRGRVDFVEALFATVMPRIAREVIPVLLPGIAGLVGFVALAGKAGVARDDAFGILRGVPNNPTTEMDIALWFAARTIQQDAAVSAYFNEHGAVELAQQYLANGLPAVAQRNVAEFLRRYGMRGVSEIDLGRTRWRDEPVQVMQMIKNYLQIADPALAPDTVHRQRNIEAEEAVERIVAQVGDRLGAPAALAARATATLARKQMGLRELPKFLVIRMFGIARRALDAGYAELVQKGVLDEASEGVYLTLDELRAIDAGYTIDWHSLVAERKTIWAAESRRRQVPDLLLGDGRAFYNVSAPAPRSDGGGDGSSEGDDPSILRGTPVSAGTVEGNVHVVLEPHKAALAHGEILVCPATDPAWTPLFLSAGGLVMEVGGMMTHGSVVAREYGIPAVVGVAQATTRLVSGMRVRVNGSNGEVTILEEKNGQS